MSPKLLEKLKEIEAAVGTNWITHFREVDTVAGVIEVTSRWNITIDADTAEEALAMFTSQVKELSDEDLKNLAHGGVEAAIKYT